MRLNAKPAMLLAIMTLGTLVIAAAAPMTASAQDSVSGHRIAVIDVAYIFKNHPAIKGQVADVENNLKGFEGTLKAKTEELKGEAEKLKAFNVGSANYSAQEERVASLESKLRLDMARKKKELADAEAQIYYQNYQRIAEGVKTISQHNGINLVIRYNSENMDLQKGESVIRGVMKNVVYHDQQLDMTQAVMEYLNRVYEVAGNGSPNRG